jgi:hypothetical protein
MVKLVACASYIYIFKSPLNLKGAKLYFTDISISELCKYKWVILGLWVMN